MANNQNLRQWKPGQSGNIAGKPAGTVHLSTHIQNLLNDESFSVDNFMLNGETFRGAPIRAIIMVGIMNAVKGDYRWAEWLAKRGYGTNLPDDMEQEHVCFNCKINADKQKYQV